MQWGQVLGCTAEDSRDKDWLPWVANGMQAYPLYRLSHHRVVDTLTFFSAYMTSPRMIQGQRWLCLMVWHIQQECTKIILGPVVGYLIDKGGTWSLLRYYLESSRESAPTEYVFVQKVLYEELAHSITEAKKFYNLPPRIYSPRKASDVIHFKCGELRTRGADGIDLNPKTGVQYISSG